MASPVRASVISTFRAFTIPLEGRKSWLYLDAIGLPTTGIGCALSTADASAHLPWLRTDGTPATPAEIRAEWAKLKGMQHLAGTTAESQRPHVALHLSDDAIEALFWSRVNAAGVALQQRFPDFATYPADAQFALLSMGFAMGVAKFDEFVRMRAALERRDWLMVAAECRMQGKGLDRRNATNKQLFEAAARVEAAGADPDVLTGWPTPSAPAPVIPAPDGPVPGAQEAFALAWSVPIDNERNPDR